MTSPTLAELGELELLRRLQPFCRQGTVGDDAAVLPGHTDNLVVTTDLLVEGVHFSDHTTSPEDVGWRAAAVNLSDLAAMGATPVGITVGLGLPGTVSFAWVEAVYRGLVACLQTYGGDILGGDVVRSPQVSLTITALGRGSPSRLLYRDRAEVGQVLVATGLHGAARAGLELLLCPESSVGLSADHRAAFIHAHQRPRPRFDVVAALHDLLGAEPGWPPIAAMDSSDGLANAVLHLTQASGVGAKLMRSRLPISPALVPWVGAEQGLEWCLYGGEDFELVLALPPDLASALLPRLGPNATLIGTVESAATGVILVNSAEATTGVPLTWDQGFQHFGS